jgi:hypothetical protein
MTETATIQEGQNIIDLAIEHLGDQSGVIALALANGVSITGNMVPGAKLVLPEVVNKEVAKLFFDKQYLPATEDSATAEADGIGAMIIGSTFIIG